MVAEKLRLVVVQLSVEVEEEEQAYVQEGVGATLQLSFAADDLGLEGRLRSSGMLETQFRRLWLNPCLREDPS